MGSEWQETTIGEIAEIVGGSTPSTKDPLNFDGDIPWITPKDLSSTHERYVSCGSRFITQKGLNSCGTKLVPRNSILLTTRAPIGYIAIAANPIATNQGFRSLIVKPEFDHEFVYYWLLANKDELIRHANGSTFMELAGSALKQIKIKIPPLIEQRRIAGILGAFDDKIELNRRMNATLEAMARALFQSWFVDFDPVRAKMDGSWRQGESLPGLPADWWHLFPDRLVDSELGPIPAGWRVGTLGDIFVNHNSKRIPISGDLREARKGNYPYYGATGILDFIDDFIFNGIFLLVGEDGSVQDSRGNGVTQYVWGKFWVNNHAHVLQGSDYISTEFLYLLMKNLVVTPFVTGAVQPKLSLGRLQMIPCIIPTPKIAQVFGGITENHFHLLRHYYDQTLLLEEFRDSLLPVLISHKE